MGVQVVDWGVNGGHCHLHAADGAFAAWGHHVVAVGRRAVADDFRVDLGATGQSVFQLFNHDHAATAGNDETVTLGVVSAGGFSGVSLYWVDNAPMASNRNDWLQCSSSPPPAKTMSCLPSWICSTAVPMQWALVAHAEEIE